MEIPLSQESIHMPDEDSRCQTEFTEVRSAHLGVTTYDLQLRKVITPSSELRFGCSWTLEIPLSQESIHMPEEDSRCQTKVSDRVYRGQVSSFGCDYV